MEKMIFQYLRDKKNQKRGVMVAIADDKNFAVGYSVANKKAGDRFDSKIGMERALGRLNKVLKTANHYEKILTEGELIEIAVPDSILKTIEFFGKRAEKYFKDKKKTFRFVMKSDVINESEADKLNKIFPTTEDKAVESDRNFDVAYSAIKAKNDVGRIHPRTFTTPRGTFVTVGNETLLVHKTNNKWNVEKV